MALEMFLLLQAARCHQRLTTSATRRPRRLCQQETLHFPPRMTKIPPPVALRRPLQVPRHCDWHPLRKEEEAGRRQLRVVPVAQHVAQSPGAELSTASVWCRAAKTEMCRPRARVLHDRGHVQVPPVLVEGRDSPQPVREGRLRRLVVRAAPQPFEIELRLLAASQPPEEAAQPRTANRAHLLV
ncbi:hypothetical protein PG994_009995 [Apiospora phragmitis]|uniref:Uncharacterized protein n=1 Tax=Apiospora phragmitis TaxID=2905665 RepID=A0ABR1TNM9_9PEZI